MTTSLSSRTHTATSMGYTRFILSVRIDDDSTSHCRCRGEKTPGGCGSRSLPPRERVIEKRLRLAACSQRSSWYLTSVAVRSPSPSPRSYDENVQQVYMACTSARLLTARAHTRGLFSGPGIDRAIAMVTASAQGALLLPQLEHNSMARSRAKGHQ